MSADAPGDRRTFLATTTRAAAGLLASQLPRLASASDDVKPQPKPTSFQLACMTLPFRQFPLDTALAAIKKAGFEYVAGGTSHEEKAGRRAFLAADASAKDAEALGRRCRDHGLEPVMIFSGVYPEAKNGLEVLTRRVEQAAAMGVEQVLTFGHTEGGNERVWVDRFGKLGPIAADHDVTIVVKQHGGSTGTGEACAKIVRAVDHPNVWVNYDAGNVMDYLNLDPIPDIQKCAKEVRSFCMKDHRNWPEDRDCGPGWGEIDHYRLLHPVAFTGLTMPLCFENVFPPLLPRPKDAATVGRYARQCREYVELLIAGLKTKRS